MMALAAACGATFVLTHGVIARRLRMLFPPLLCCPMCAGFWIGCLVGLLESLYAHSGPLDVARNVPVMGFATSLLSTAAAIVLCTVGSWLRTRDVLPPECVPKQAEDKNGTTMGSGREARST